MLMSPRNWFLAASAAAVMFWCGACTSHVPSSHTGPGSTRSSGAVTAPGGPSPLVRTRLAPGTVGTPAAGLHCRIVGTSPGTYRPDPACNPGAVDDAVTQDNIGSTICVSGFTAKIRPPASATDKVKQQMYFAYGISDKTSSELDHLVSLELGGSNDARNLWIEPGQIPNPKDTVENALHKAVCAHKVTLAAAQNAIATDWTTALAVTGVGK
jgi:hypothetical protein